MQISLLPIFNRISVLKISLCMYQRNFNTWTFLFHDRYTHLGGQWVGLYSFGMNAADFKVLSLSASLLLTFGSFGLHTCSEVIYNRLRSKASSVSFGSLWVRISQGILLSTGIHFNLQFPCWYWQAAVTSDVIWYPVSGMGTELLKSSSSGEIRGDIAIQPPRSDLKGFAFTICQVGNLVPSVATPRVICLGR